MCFQSTIILKLHLQSTKNSRLFSFLIAAIEISSAKAGSKTGINQSRHQPKLLSTKARHPSNVFLKFSSPGGRLPTIYQSYRLTAVRLRQHRNQSRHQPKLLSTKARRPSNVFLKFSSPGGRLPTIYQSYRPNAVRLRQHRDQSRI